MREVHLYLDDVTKEEEDQAAWWGADTLEDLGELMARWLEGTITYQPAYYSTLPDPETESLIPVLVEMNRAGFVTDMSQPGYIGENRSQRADVSGFADWETVRRIDRAIVGTDLILTSFEASLSVPCTIAITKTDGVPGTFDGGSLGLTTILNDYGEDLHPGAIRSLLMAEAVTIIDFVWGRSDVLWEVVRKAVCEPCECRRGTAD